MRKRLKLSKTLSLTQRLTPHESFDRSRFKLKLKTKYRIKFLSYNLLTGTKERGSAKLDSPEFSYSKFIGLKCKLLI